MAVTLSHPLVSMNPRPDLGSHQEEVYTALVLATTTEEGEVRGSPPLLSSLSLLLLLLYFLISSACHLFGTNR